MSKVKEITKDLNSKSTKLQIQSALNEALEVIKEQEEKMFNPEMVKEEQKNVETLEKAKEIVSTKEVKVKEIDRNLKQLNEDYEVALLKLNEIHGNYESIEEAITLQKEKMNELYGIDSSLVKLTDLLNLYTSKNEQLENEYKVKTKKEEEEYQLKIDIMTGTLNNLQSEYTRELELINKQRKIEKEEYDYNLKRERKIEKDEYEDEKAKQKQEFLKSMIEQEADIDARLILLNNREKDLEKKEADFIELQQKVEEIPSLLDELKENTIKKTVEKCNNDYKYRLELLTTKKDNEIEILKNSNTSLIDAINEYKDDISELKDTINQMRSEMNELASKSMETASNLNYVKNLENIVKDSNVNKNNILSSK